MLKKKFPEYFLIPFAVLYGMATAIRNKLFDWRILRSHEFDLPVISLGNLTAGGTGKTPHTEYLIGLLKDEYRVAVLSRGYGRETRGFILAGPSSTAGEIGDEPCQIKTKFPDITVAVDEKRVRGIRNLLKMDVDVILLDDAFQHRYVTPGLSILLIDYGRPVTRDHLLPFGRLREPVSSIKRANLILITRSPVNLKAIDMRVRVKDFRLDPFQHLYFTGMQPGAPMPVFGKAIYPSSAPDGISALLVSGIANPGSFTATASAYASVSRRIDFPDHHAYNLRDLQRIHDSFSTVEGHTRVILTTEKDAARLRMYPGELSEVSELLFYIPIHVGFLNKDTENFNSQIMSYVRSNKRNSILHQGKNQVPA